MYIVVCVCMWPFRLNSVYIHILCAMPSLEGLQGLSHSRAFDQFSIFFSLSFLPSCPSSLYLFLTRNTCVHSSISMSHFDLWTLTFFILSTSTFIYMYVFVAVTSWLFVIYVVGSLFEQWIWRQYLYTLHSIYI